MIRRSVWKQAACALVLCAMALLTLPLDASEEKAESTKQDIAVTFSNPCLGEPISYTGTLHLVTKGGQIIHGNHMNAKGYGLVTGTRYVITGSPANLVPAGDGYFLYHLSWIGTGPDASKFIITAKGPIFGEPVEIIQSQCIDPGP